MNNLSLERNRDDDKRLVVVVAAELLESTRDETGWRTPLAGSYFALPRREQQLR